MYKMCSTCRAEKLLTCFSKKKSNKDGLQYSCKLCVKKWNTENKEYIEKYREENKDKIKVLCSNWYILNRETILKSNKENRNYISEREKQYRKAHPDKRNALNAKRRALKLKATPSWLSNEQLLEIEKFYTQAKNLKLTTDEEYHVDHIVPLQGKNICGLHVPWNLQVILAKENLIKSNKLQEDIL